MGNTGAPWNIPWPEYPEAADGPDAFKDQAEALVVAMNTVKTDVDGVVSAESSARSRMDRLVYGLGSPVAIITQAGSGITWSVMTLTQPANVDLEIDMTVIVTNHVQNGQGANVLARPRAGNLNFVGPDWVHSDTPLQYSLAATMNETWILPSTTADRSIQLAGHVWVRAGADRRVDQIIFRVRPVLYRNNLNL